MNPETGYIRLLKAFSEISDPRQDRGKRHLLGEVLFITVVGLIAGANDAEGVSRFCQRNLLWLRQFMQLKHGVPAHDTILRVLALVVPAVIEAIARSWVDEFRAGYGFAALDAPLQTGGAQTVAQLREQIAADGKTLRGSFDHAAGQRALHSVSLFATRLGMTLAQKVVGEKSNEIIALPELLRSVNIKRAVITIDAMGCQREIAATIVDAHGDYVLHVEGNQPTLLGNCQTAFADLVRRRLPGEAKPVFDVHREVDKGHGRIETRTCTVLPVAGHVEKIGDWKGLAKIAAVARERLQVVNGKSSQTVDYYIISETQGALSALAIADMVRNHWAIENSNHHVLERIGDPNVVRLERPAAKRTHRAPCAPPDPPATARSRLCAAVFALSTAKFPSGKQTRPAQRQQAPSRHQPRAPRPPSPDRYRAPGRASVPYAAQSI